MCNMDEGMSHHKQLDCRSLAQPSGFDDINDIENDGSKTNVTDIGSCEGRQSFIEDDQEVSRILDKEFPILYSLSRTITKGTKDLVKSLSILEYNSANSINDIESLANLIQHGFIPKDILQKLYEGNEEKDSSMFFMELKRLKHSKHVFVAMDQDKMNEFYPQFVVGTLCRLLLQCHRQMSIKYGVTFLRHFTSYSI